MDNRYASRGGLKLQEALTKFNFEVKDLTVLDVGSSTGGFVDCLLQNGAKKVYSVDTAYGELAWKLRNDPKVVVMERTNILHLKELPQTRHSRPEDHQVASSAYRESINDVDQKDSRLRENDDIEKKVDLITIDASWTKLELILPVIKQFLKENGYIIALLKPHYEAGKQLLVKGVLPEDQLEKVTTRVEEKIKEQGWNIKEKTESPILGGGGNTEILLLITPQT
jgi:23S rRNA (cytidine1920-2'-O)/16S rRNA (cytidine1409-2'-O)-methyltransferase